MIPILESGAPLSLNTDKAPVSATTTADAGSGATFGQVLSAAEQSPPAPAVEQGLAGSAAGDGNVLHPGGKDLPLDASVFGEVATSVVLDLQLLAQPQLTPVTVPIVTPLIAQGSEPLATEILLPVTPAASAEVLASAALAAPATAGPQLAAQTALPSGLPESVGIKQRPFASPAATPSLLSSSLAPPETVDAATARLQAVLPAATGAVTEVDSTASRLPLGPLVTPDDAGRRVLTPATENTAPGVRAELQVAQKVEQSLDKMTAELALARSKLEAAGAGASSEVNRAANPTAVQVQSAPLSAAMLPTSMNTALPPGSTISTGGMMVSVTGEAGWNHEVAQRISVMFRGGVQEAKLQLNPPELGRLDVKITTEGDQARVLFTVQGAETREVIEQALPRLREMLEESGMSLSRFDVADQPDSRRDSDGDSETASGIAESDEDALQAEVAPLQHLTETRSLVDYYV